MTLLLDRLEMIFTERNARCYSVRLPVNVLKSKERVQSRNQRIEERNRFKVVFREWNSAQEFQALTVGQVRCLGWINSGTIVRGLGLGQGDPETSKKRQNIFLILTKDNVKVLFHFLNEEVIHRKRSDFDLFVSVLAAICIFSTMSAFSISRGRCWAHHQCSEAC